MDNANFWFNGATGGSGTVIGNSLRFRGAQKLAGNPGTNNGEYTLSLWFKLGAIPQVNATIFGRQYSTNVSAIEYDAERLNFREDGVISPADGFLRDPSAWYHLVISKADGNNSGGIAWINGVQQAATDGFLQQSTLPFTIGARFNNSAFFEGYIAEVHLVDDQRLDPTDFGEFNDNGVWVPVDYTGTYGASGFYLDFSDPADIGADSSGNGNNFTPTGFDTTDTTSPDYDWMQDSPTQNWATLNPLDTGWWYWRGSPSSAGATGTIDYANLSSNTNVRGHTVLTQYPQPGKKLYLEYTTGAGVAPNYGSYFVGFIPKNQNPVGTDYLGSTANTGSVGFYFDGTIWFNSASVGSCAGFNNYTNVGLAYDVDTGNVWQARNGVWYNGGDPATGTNPTYTLPAGTLYGFAFNERGNTAATKCFINAGQQPLKYNIPTGFTTPVSDNMPDATIKAGTNGFRALTGPGADILDIAQGSNSTGTNWDPTITTGFTSGLWWIKDYANSNNWQLMSSFDTTKAFSTPTTTAFIDYVAPTGASIAYCWATPSSTTQLTGGDINPTAYVNQETGISILQYNGIAQQNIVHTVAHGLGKPPEFVITKLVSSSSAGFSYGFATWHKDIDPGYNLYFNTSESQLAGNFFYGNSSSSDFNSTTYTVVSIDTNHLNTTGSTAQRIAYCWTSIPGYSAFGTYTGNGSADGPFAFCGFRPAWVLIKVISGQTDHWFIYDSVRDTHNLTYKYLRADLTNSENTDITNASIDILSNGFKLRHTGTNTNGSGNRYIYAAFAENPFGGSNVSPANAR